MVQVASCGLFRDPRQSQTGADIVNTPFGWLDRIVFQGYYLLVWVACGRVVVREGLALGR